MFLVRFSRSADPLAQVGALVDNAIHPLPLTEGSSPMAVLLQHRRRDILALVDEVQTAEPLPLDTVSILPPIDAQEIWAAGVTYRRSVEARMAESTQKDAYDLVYDADRPEIFFKGHAQRLTPAGGSVTIRSDSRWDVPEPEFTLVINAYGEVIGYTVGNDMSSRDIEGQNPLYLPQAKIWDGSSSLANRIRLADDEFDPADCPIAMTIERGGDQVFTGDSNTSNLHRSLDDLVDWLFRGLSFPFGVFLMTGTGIVPPDDFTLNEGDRITIDVAGIDTLVNTVRSLDVTKPAVS